MSRSTRSARGVLVEHQRVLSQKNLHGAPSRLAPRHSWYILWNLTAGTLSRSLRSTQGVLVEHQRILDTVESPRGACQAVSRKPRSRATRVVTSNRRTSGASTVGGLYRPWPESQSAGLFKEVFLPPCRVSAARCYSVALRILPPRQAPAALSAPGPGGPNKTTWHKVGFEARPRCTQVPTTTQKLCARLAGSDMYNI